MSAELFVSKLEEAELLDEAVLRKLREQVNRTGKDPSPESIAKFLINKGFLTEFQANKVLVSMADPPSPSSSQPVETIEAVEVIEDVSGIEELDEIEEVVLASQPEPVEVLEEVEEIAPLDLTQVDPLMQPALAAADPFAAAVPGGEEAVPVGVAVDEDGEEVKPTFQGKRIQGNQWESKWVMLLPTVLILISLIGAVLYFVLTSKSADQKWAEAETAYESENYANSIEMHTDFAEYYKGSDPRAEIAVVRTRMAKMRGPFNRKNWELALTKFEENLPSMPDEIAAVEDSAEQNNVRAELAGLLPQNASGLVDQAEAAKDTDIAEAKRLLALANANFELINNGGYIPRKEREKPVNAERIKALRENMARVSREVKKEDYLLATIKEMNEKVAANDARAAGQAFASLIGNYPELQADDRLKKEIRALSEKQRDLITSFSPNLETVEGGIPREGASIVLATRTGKAVTELKGEILPYLVNGAVYGIDVGLGEILWRTHVGLETQITPQWLELEDRKILAANQKDNSLICLNPEDGSVVWRTVIGQPFSRPLVIEDQIFVTVSSGQIISLEAVGGFSSRGARLPQDANVPPEKFVTGSQRKILQLADDSQLYMLSAGNLECTDVIYLAHKRGSIVVPPVMLSQHVVIAENRSNNKCNIRVFNLDENRRFKEAQKPITLSGHVTTPLAIYGRRVVVVTNSEPIYVFEIDAATPERPLKAAVNEFNLSTTEGLTRHYHASEGNLWVGDKGLTRLKIQTQSQKLSRETVSNSHDLFLGPMSHYPQANLLVHVRRRLGSALVSISGVKADDHKEIWRLDLGAKLTGAPFIDADTTEPVAVSSQGDFFALDEPGVQQPYRRSSTAEQDLNFSYQVIMKNGIAAFTGNESQNRMLVYDKDNQARPTRLAPLEITDDPLTTEPINFAERVLLASRSGMVRLVNPTGNESPARYMPETKSGAVVSWQRPAAVGDSMFVIADHNGIVYTVSRSGNTLQPSSKVNFAGKFAGPISVVDNRAILAAIVGRQYQLVSFALPGLAENKTLAVPDAIEFGPKSINDEHVVIGTDGGQLICANSSAEKVWTCDIGKTYVSGVVPGGNVAAVILMDGRVVWLDASDGSVLKEENIRESTDRTDGLIHKGKLYFGGADGTMHVVDAP